MLTSAQAQGLLDACRAKASGWRRRTRIKGVQEQKGAGPHLHRGTSLATASCPQPKRASSGTSGPRGADLGAPERTARTRPAVSRAGSTALGSSMCSGEHGGGCLKALLPLTHGTQGPSAHPLKPSLAALLCPRLFPLPNTLLPFCRTQMSAPPCFPGIPRDNNAPAQTPLTLTKGISSLSSLRVPLEIHPPLKGPPSQTFTSLGRSEIKSRWNWGSITCIMCFIWGGSQRSMSSSRASSFSAPLQL